MTIPTYNAFDGDGGSNVPRRPSLDDLGGAAYQDFVPLPDETTMPSSAMENQNEMVLHGVTKLMDIAKIYVTFPGGVPTKTTVVGAGDIFSTSDVTLTDNGNGDTTVAIGTNALPTEVFPPDVRLVPPTVDVWTYALYKTAGHWAVATFKSGVLTDCPFVIEFA